ncbi:epidermal growth factor receptor-like [Glandiceps talaboti]
MSSMKRPQTFVCSLLCILFLQCVQSLLSETCQPDEYVDDGGVCQQCDGLCPKICPGFGSEELQRFNKLDERSLHMFVNCTVINGSMLITDATFDGDPFLGNIGLEADDLEVFSTVRHITGHLTILQTPPSFRDLSAFRNLEVISGQDLHEGDALKILFSMVQSLGLTSLKRIGNGNVNVKRNRNLCYISNDIFDGIIQHPDSVVTVEYNRDQDRCRNEGSVCNNECTTSGCWGPGSNECLQCRNYHFDGFCVNNCTSNTTRSVLVTSSKECEYCHNECLQDCSGLGPNECEQCKNVQDGQYCMDRCPASKFPDANNICQQCHKNCDKPDDGYWCSGTGNFIGKGGCRVCDPVELDVDDEMVACLPPGSQCPEGFLEKFTEFTTEDGLINITVCQPCPDGYYPETKDTCALCHDECAKGCHGKDAWQCNECEHYRLQQDNDTIICVKECPSEKPFIMEGSICVIECATSMHSDSDKHCQASGAESHDIFRLTCWRIFLYGTCFLFIIWKMV